MPKTRPRISCRRPVACAWEPAAPGARIDHGLREGQQISPFYDPMLGKIIAHGATREEARRKLLRAVQDTVLLGVQSNQRLLASLLQHPQFISGEFSTGFIAQHFSDHTCLHPHVPGAEELAIAAALFYQASARNRIAPRWPVGATTPVCRSIIAWVWNQTWTVELKAMPGGLPERMRAAAWI
jgi:geranyl-CoA carboxylase alpha subunit